MAKAVIITGATGRQGGALVKALLGADADFEIIAVSRDPTSSSAQRLASKSPKIKVISGNLEQPDEIFKNARNVTKLPIWGVYSVQAITSMNPFDDPETRQGKGLVDAALRNDVEMFVYSSVDRGGDASYGIPTHVPHFKTKYEIEHHLVDASKGTKMSYTILRPVAFMDNQEPGFIGEVFATIWQMKLQEKPLQLIATSDVGYFGAQAFLNPAEYENRAINLAADEVSFSQYKQIFKEKTGQELRTTYKILASLVLLMSRDMRRMMNWFVTDGYGVDIAELREKHPHIKTYGQWLEQESKFVQR